MEGPGMSLFQGAASIHINNSAQDRLQEQEELEDQRRRNEELKHKLANAFDDLLDDDEASSVNSSGNFTLDAAQTNGVPKQTRPVPPTYMESLNHLKEQHCAETPKPYCETPKNHMTPHIRRQDDSEKTTYSYGAGDGQNNFYHQEYRGNLNVMDNRQEYMNNEQLKVMYEMRVKECQQLAAQTEKLDTEIESLRARLAAAVSDRDKAELSLQEAHHLLASSKHKILELEQRVAALTEQLAVGEQEREQLRLETRATAASLQDAQQRLHTLQVAHTHDTDALFREQQDRHREEMERLQNDLIKVKTKLDERENENRMLEKRCLEKDREKEAILIDKGATINRLANELEAAQSRLVSGETARLKEKVSQLTSERNSAKEQVKELGSKLEVTAHELVLCRNKLSANQKEYETWRSTLNQILIESLPDTAIVGEPASPGKLATLKDVLSRHKQQLQKLSALQEDIAKRDKKLELARKQESELRAWLDEAKGVEMQLGSRLAVLQSKLDLLASNSDAELLQTYKQQSEHLLAQLDEAKAELKAVELKYAELEMDHDRLKSEKGSRASLVQEANADLLRELERCSQQLKDTLRENGELKTLYLQVCSSRDTAARELKDLQSKAQMEKDRLKCQEKEYVERLERERKQIELLTAELTSSKEEVERANKRILELQKEFTNKQNEFTDKLNKFLADEKSAMRKEMEACKQCEKHIKHARYLEEQLSKSSIKLATQESNEALMKELKGKAEFFQQYIMERFRKLCEQRSVATSTEPEPVPEPVPVPVPVPAPAPSAAPAVPIDRLVQSCDEALAAKTALMMKEKAIRDQIAEKFTLEMKTVEMNCTRKLKEMENEHLQINGKLQELLERKATEVEILKDFIISERAKVTQLLESKEDEISVLIKEHNEIQAECQKAKDGVVEWRRKAERYQERLSRMTSIEGVLKLETEKNSSNTREMQALWREVGEKQNKLAQLEQKYQKLQEEHQTIVEKYKNCKKTVYTYKEYMMKKDTHVTNEVNRIQDEYRKLFVRLQNQLDFQLNCRVQEDRLHGRRRQTPPLRIFDFTEKLNKLNEDFAKLAKDTYKEPDPSK